jgi:hypothetical protein
MTIPMRRHHHFLLAAVAATTSTTSGQFLPPLKQKILIPAYFAPCHDPNDPPHGSMTCDWDQIVSDTASHEFSAIGHVLLNPDSGPGTGCIPSYLNLTSRIRAADANMGILGYVHTSYGTRPAADVQAEVDM